jgi:hypothetical protein
MKGWPVDHAIVTTCSGGDHITPQDAQACNLQHCKLLAISSVLPSCYLWRPPSNLFASNKVSSSTRCAWYVRHSQDLLPRAQHMHKEHFHDAKSWPLCCISPAPAPSATALLHRKWLKRTHEVLNFDRRTVTPVAGSIFRPLSQTQNLRSEFRFSISPDFKFCFTWYPTDIILCLWSGFISPRIRTFVEKCFHGLFSEKKCSKSGGVPSFLSWSWGQLLPQRKTLPTRLLGLLEKQSKIWRYGRSWTHV